MAGRGRARRTSGWLIFRGCCSDRALEAWLGHATFGAMAEMGSLAVLNAGYAFEAAASWEDASFWPAVLDKLRACRGLGPPPPPPPTAGRKAEHEA